MDHWAGHDFDFDSHDSVTSHARRPAVKWAGLLVAWVVVAGLLSLLHLGVLTWVIMAGLIAYVVYSVLRDTPRGGRRSRRPRFATTAGTTTGPDDDLQFNAPPGWPDPPPGWTPPPGWQPDPRWPQAPAGWRFWLPSARRGLGGRTTPARSRHGDGYRSADRWL